MTMRSYLTRIGFLLVLGVCITRSSAAFEFAMQDPAEPEPPAFEIRQFTRPGARGGEPSRLQNFADLTKGATKHEGFITLYQKDQHLYAEIKPHQLEQPILAPMVIARGSASAGQPLNFGDEWVIAFRRVGENLQLLRKNIHFTAPSGTPLDKAVKQNYTDSILLSLPILSINPQGATMVIDFADIFLTDFAQVGFGGLDRSRSRWFKIRTYPDNDEIQVEATFTGGRFRGFFGGASPVVDSRGITLVLHYSLCKRPTRVTIRARPITAWGTS